MKIIEFSANFAWSENGWDVTEYLAGDITEVSDACADACTAAGKGTEVDADALQAATEAHAKLLAKADKAEAAADAAEAAAVAARANAVEARQAARAARINRAGAAHQVDDQAE